MNEKYDINIRSYTNNQKIEFARAILLSFNYEFFQLISSKNYQFSDSDVAMELQLTNLTQEFAYNEYSDLELIIQMILDLCRSNNNLNMNFKNKMEELIIMFKRMDGEGSGASRKYNI